MFSRVDLPQPEGPMMATNSPSLISNDTPLSAVVSIFRPENLGKVGNFDHIVCCVFDYSFFRESTGLALAARQLWSVTTAKVMATTARKLTTKIHAGIFVRKANWLIQRWQIV